MMASFPSLSRAMSHRGFTFRKLIDPTVRAEFASGAIATRPRFEGTVPDLYSLVYHHISESDVTALKTFQDTVKVGAVTFNWTNILTSTMWVMRLSRPIKFGLEPKCIDKYYAQIEMFGTVGSSSSSSLSSSSSSSSESSSSSSESSSSSSSSSSS